MAGTLEGARKTAAKNLARDPDHYKKIGAKGGAAKVPKGFALMTPEQRSAAGKRGGEVRRGKAIANKWKTQTDRVKASSNSSSSNTKRTSTETHQSAEPSEAASAGSMPTSASIAERFNAVTRFFR